MGGRTRVRVVRCQNGSNPSKNKHELIEGLRNKLRAETIEGWPKRRNESKHTESKQSEFRNSIGELATAFAGRVIGDHSGIRGRRGAFPWWMFRWKDRGGQSRQRAPGGGW